MQWTDEMRSEITYRWEVLKQKPRRIRSEMGLTVGQLAGAITRFQLHKNRRGAGLVLGADHPAVVEGRTLFPNNVRLPWRLLRPGGDSQKLGARVTKGSWRGFPVYAITLEERATCPRSCVVYNACFGNGMNWAVRAPHGPDMERQLWREFSELQRRHPRGYAVRAHVLGDWYSVSYVDLWEAALDHFPGLHVWGYSAWQPDTPIGAAIASLRDRRWKRFAVRTSGASEGPRTFVIQHREQAHGAIVCPAQTGASRSCSTCSLCWALAARDKAVAFLSH